MAEVRFDGRVAIVTGAPEDVRDGFESVQRESGYLVPTTAVEEPAYFRLPR